MQKDAQCLIRIKPLCESCKEVVLSRRSLASFSRMLGAEFVRAERSTHEVEVAFSVKMEALERVGAYLVS